MQLCIIRNLFKKIMFTKYKMFEQYIVMKSAVHECNSVKVKKNVFVS